MASGSARKIDWPFQHPPNLAVLTQRQVLEGKSPILFVIRDEDDEGWQLLNGKSVRGEDARVVALREIFNLDRSVASIAALSPGYLARRTARDAPWRISSYFVKD